MNKGQISVPIMSLIAGIGIIAGGFSAYFGTQIANANRFGKVEGEVNVLKSENTTMKEDVKEIKTDVKEIKNLLIKFNGNRY